MKADLLALRDKLMGIEVNPKSNKRKSNPFSWISRVYKNCFKGRIRTSELVEQLTTISRKPEKLEKPPRTIQDPRLVLPNDMLYMIVVDIPIKNDIDISHCINMMKVLWEPLEKDRPCALGTIDAELLDNWVLSQKISIAKLHISDEESKHLFAYLRYIDLNGRVPRNRN